MSGAKIPRRVIKTVIQDSLENAINYTGEMRQFTTNGVKDLKRTEDDEQTTVIETVDTKSTDAVRPNFTVQDLLKDTTDQFTKNTNGNFTTVVDEDGDIHLAVSTDDEKFFSELQELEEQEYQEDNEQKVFTDIVDKQGYINEILTDEPDFIANTNPEKKKPSNITFDDFDEIQEYDIDSPVDDEIPYSENDYIVNPNLLQKITDDSWF